jgi:hypothetical protein
MTSTGERTRTQSDLFSGGQVVHPGLPRSNLKCVVSGSRVSAIANRERVGPSLAQRLHAGFTASQTSVEELHAVVIDQVPVDLIHSFAVFQNSKVRFLAGRGGE